MWRSLNLKKGHGSTLIMSGSLKSQAFSLYRHMIRIALDCSNPEHKKYILKETRAEFIKYRNLSNEYEIGEQLHHGRTRILCFECYGDPYPRSVRDMQRVLQQGAGYTKKGKMHQKWSKREGKFHSHDKRQERMQVYGGTKYKKLSRKPGEYDLPVFEHQSAAEHLTPSAFSDFKQNMDKIRNQNMSETEANARKWQKFAKSEKTKKEITEVTKNDTVDDHHENDDDSGK